MANTDQPVLLDAMIARLEKANARAYEKFALRGEGVLTSNEDAKRQPTDQQNLSAIPNGQSWRAESLFIALIALLLAACATAVAWEPSYGEAAKRFARWANPWILQSFPHTQTVPWEGPPAVPFNSPDIAQRLQRLADRLANIEQQIEQLRAGQEQTIRSDTAVSEQFRTSQQDMFRDNAETAEKLNAALAQLDRQNAAVARQVTANQEQLADLASPRGRYSRKHLRRNPSR
jgi:methyl-accepting chemotaxis protein